MQHFCEAIIDDVLRMEKESEASQEICEIFGLEFNATPKSCE